MAVDMDLMDNDFPAFKKKYPEIMARVEKTVEKEQKEKLLQEAKRLGKKKLSTAEYNTFQKKQLDRLILSDQAYRIKKKLIPYSPEVRGVLQESLTGASISEAAEQIDTLINIYHKTHPAEPIGQSERQDDWPVTITESERKADLDRKFQEALG